MIIQTKKKKEIFAPRVKRHPTGVPERDGASQLLLANLVCGCDM